MRVLQVAAVPAMASRGGAERFCAELSGWLRQDGIDVFVASPDSAADVPLTRNDSPLLRRLYYDYYSPENARRLGKAIDELKPDIVHAHNTYGIGSQIVRVASQRVPTVVTLHDYWPLDFFIPIMSGGRMRYPVRRPFATPWRLLHRAVHRRHLRGTTLVSPSRYLAGRMSEGGYEGVRVIPNGVDVPAESTSYEPGVLFVGRMTREKGLAEALPVIAPAASRAGWQVDVVGDGPQRERLAAAHPSVRFHGRSEPEPFYRRASVLAVPSLWPENMPYAVLEGMSYGIAVIASGIGGIPELIEHGRTGLLFDPADGTSLAEALREVVERPGRARELGSAARERVARDFAWELIGPKYVALYHELTAAPERGRVAVGSESR